MKNYLSILILVAGLITFSSHANAQTFVPPPIGIGSGSISYDSSNFYYSANGSSPSGPNDIGYIAFYSPFLTTSNAWQMSVDVSIPAVSLTTDGTLSFGLAVGTNGIGVNTSFVNLDFESANHAGTTGNDELPNGSYGNFAGFSSQHGLGYYTNTTPISPYSTWNGSSYNQLSGSSSLIGGPWSTLAINGTLKLSYDGSSTITGYFNGNALGSYDISSWGNGPLLGAVYGTSAGWTDSNVKLGSNLTFVPEPSTYAFLGLGALTLIVVYRRKVA
jgi:PEP-CTERM motif